MLLLAQQGYGRSDKIERGMRDGSLSGVILSPRDTAAESLQSFIESLRSEFGSDLEVLFDPQFFASVLPDATDRHLPEYPYYRPGLRRSSFLSASHVSRFVRNTIEYQASLDLTSVISPTVLFDNFSESSCQTALQLAAESCSAYADIGPDQHLLLGFVMGEAAVADTDSVYEFLDITTGWEADGFYIVIEPTNTRYPNTIDSERLANLMYIIYSLAEVNEKEVVLGYADFEGLLFGAAGATSMATGWYSGLRQFSRTRWLPSTGGRAPNPRYSSAPLLNSITVVPELLAAYRVGRTDACLSDTDYDVGFRDDNPADVPWGRPEQTLQHWAVLAALIDQTDSSDCTDRLRLVRELIDNAIDVYEELEDQGVTFDGPTGPARLALWSQAIDRFSELAGL